LLFITSAAGNWRLAAGNWLLATGFLSKFEGISYFILWNPDKNGSMIKASCQPPAASRLLIPASRQKPAASRKKS
jgi:hypothetical protein